MGKNFLTFLLRMWMSQRGEVGDDDESLEVVVDEDGSEDDQSDGSDDEDSDDEGDDSGDDASQEDDPIAALRKEYDAKIADLKKDNNRLGYALRTAGKKADEEKKEDSPKFSDSQLLAMWEEHKDDPKVVMQIIKEMQSSAVAGVEASAEKKAEIASKKTTVTQFLKSEYPDVLEEGSDLHKDVQGAKDHLVLGEHPFGDFLALAASQLMQMPEIIKNIKEEAKKEVLAGKAEKARKQSIGQNTSHSGAKNSGGKKGRLTLSKTQMETAKMLFGTDKKKIAAYARMLGQSEGVNAITVE